MSSKQIGSLKQSKMLYLSAHGAETSTVFEQGKEHRHAVGTTGARRNSKTILCTLLSTRQEVCWCANSTPSMPPVVPASSSPRKDHRSSAKPHRQFTDDQCTIRDLWLATDVTPCSNHSKVYSSPNSSSHFLAQTTLKITPNPSIDFFSPTTLKITRR